MAKNNYNGGSTIINSGGRGWSLNPLELIDELLSSNYRSVDDLLLYAVQ